MKKILLVVVFFVYAFTFLGATDFTKINKEDCILLFGEIGVGKTTLTRALINNLQKLSKINIMKQSKEK